MTYDQEYLIYMYSIYLIICDRKYFIIFFFTNEYTLYSKLKPVIAYSYDSLFLIGMYDVNFLFASMAVKSHCLSSKISYFDSVHVLVRYTDMVVRQQRIHLPNKTSK